MSNLLIRDVEIEGRAGLDVRSEGGRIVAVVTDLTGNADSLDGHGGA